jgi:hypothetical protein
MAYSESPYSGAIVRSRPWLVKRATDHRSCLSSSLDNIFGSHTGASNGSIDLSVTAPRDDGVTRMFITHTLDPGGGGPALPEKSI